jgi:hypothetical protein
MEAFFTRVLTAVFSDPKVLAGIESIVKSAVADETEALKTTMAAIPVAINSLEQNAISNIDAMDGKVGNLQEQLTNIPGQIIQGVLGPFEQMLKGGPFGGLFGQQ